MQTILASVIGIASNNNLVEKVISGNQCFIITDSTNFYSDAGGQIADIGKIYNEVSCM